VHHAGDGGAVYLKDNSTLLFSNVPTTPINNKTNSSSARVAGRERVAQYRTVVIAGNRAKGRGGGVAISGQGGSFDVAAVLQAATNNSAEFDVDASVPLKQISVVGPSHISGLASRWVATSFFFF
jgi:hypothetical protein